MDSLTLFQHLDGAEKAISEGRLATALAHVAGAKDAAWALVEHGGYDRDPCYTLMGKAYHRVFCCIKRRVLSILNWASVTVLSFPCRLMAVQVAAAPKKTARTMNA